MVSEARRIAEEKTRLLRSIAAERQSKKPITNPSSDVLEALLFLDECERHHASYDRTITAAKYSQVKATIERLSAELERAFKDGFVEGFDHRGRTNDLEEAVKGAERGWMHRASLTHPPTNYERSQS